MAFTIRSVEYSYANVRDELGAAYRVLSQLAELGVNLLAFTAVPSGPSLAQFALFPEDPNKLVAEGRAARLPLDGPHHALLVQGDDELGALAGVHERLVEAGVDIYASSGVTDGRGSFGYVLYVREDQFEKAASALGLLSALARAAGASGSGSRDETGPPTRHGRLKLSVVCVLRRANAAQRRWLVRLLVTSRFNLPRRGWNCAKLGPALRTK